MSKGLMDKDPGKIRAQNDRVPASLAFGWLTVTCSALMVLFVVMVKSFKN